jgi:hypothetical protein
MKKIAILVMFLMIFPILAFASGWEKKVTLSTKREDPLLRFNVGNVKSALDLHCANMVVRCRVVIDIDHPDEDGYAEEWDRQCNLALNSAKKQNGPVTWSIADKETVSQVWKVRPEIVGELGAQIMCKPDPYKLTSATPTESMSFTPAVTPKLEPSIPSNPEPSSSVTSVKPTKNSDCLFDGGICRVGINTGGQLISIAGDGTYFSGFVGASMWIRTANWDTGLRADFGGSSLEHQSVWIAFTADSGWVPFEWLGVGGFLTYGFGGSARWINIGPRIKYFPLEDLPLSVQLDVSIMGRQDTAETEMFTAGEQGRFGGNFMIRYEFDL